MRSDTELLNKLAALLDDPHKKLLLTRDGIYVNNIYDLREWIEAQEEPDRAARPHGAEKSESRSEAMKERWRKKKLEKLFE